MHGDAGNDTLGAYGTGDDWIWGGDGNDTFEFWNAGRVFATGGAGDDTYVVTDSMLQLDGGFVQVFDFHGGDQLDEQFVYADNVERNVFDWGPNTGITYTDLATGKMATVMLVGTTLEEAVGMIPVEHQLLA